VRKKLKSVNIWEKYKQERGCPMHFVRLANTLLKVHETTRDETGSHFVTQRPSDPGIQRPGDPVDPVTLFYNELQMSTYVRRSILRPKRF